MESVASGQREGQYWSVGGLVSYILTPSGTELSSVRRERVRWCVCVRVCVLGWEQARRWAVVD